MNYLNIPDASFFNSKGEYVDYNKTASDCNAGVDSFLTDLKEFASRNPDSIRRQKDLNDLLGIRPTKRPAITVYITFTLYAGKLNRDKSFAWVDLIEKARTNGVDIEYYLVNCDFLKVWNIPPDVQRQLGIKS